MITLINEDENTKDISVRVDGEYAYVYIEDGVEEIGLKFRLSYSQAQAVIAELETVAKPENLV